MDTTKVVAFGSGLLAGLWGIRHLTSSDLEGKRVLITGGSKGLGFLLAREFGNRGCRVAICARSPDELERAQDRLLDDGIEVYADTCDVSDRQRVEDFIAEVTEFFGGVDILVNNAGIIQVAPFEEVTTEDFELAIDTMFWGVLHPTMAVLPQMRQRGAGQIVNITSIGGKVSVPHLLPYSCAKFAAMGLSEGLTAELKGSGVRVTTIVPGLMRTGSHYNALFKGQRGREFAWFSMGASMPGLTMDGRRAAKKIVEATRRGRAERVLSIPAKILNTVHGLLPGVTAAASGLLRRLALPKPGDPPGREAAGEQIYGELTERQRRLLDTFTALGKNAASRYQN